MKPNTERVAWLKSLSPRDAVKAFLDGEFGLNEEFAIVEAIQKDSRITINENEIMDILCDELEEESLDADAVFARLVAGE
jgi:hypothetical protein